MKTFPVEKKEKKKNVYDSIVVITFFSSVMSVYPTTSVVKNGIRRAKLNYFFTYWVSILYIIIYTFCLIVANVDQNIITSKEEYNFNRIAYLLYVVTVVTEIWVTFLQYAMTIFSTPYTLVLLELIRKSDRILERIGYRFKYATGYLINFTVISFGMYFIGFNIGLEIWNSPRENVGNSSVFESIVIGWPQFLIHLVESMFILSNLLLYTRFFAVNLIMETLFKSNGGKVYLQEPPRFLNKMYKFQKEPDVSDEYVIYSCMKAQYWLYRTTVKANNIFGAILTFSALIQFTTIAFAVCFCYYRVTTHPVAASVWLLWAILRMFELVRKAFVVQLLRNEADKSIHLVNKLMMLSWSSRITRRIIAAATMYLIVTYQFQQGLNQNCNNTTTSI